MTRPGELVLRRVRLSEPGPADLVVETEWSGISTGTERLLWTGRMPPFPGLGYPLVPGYETVGRVAAAGPEAGVDVGRRVFVPGASCFGEIRGLFGGAASRLVVPGARVVPIPDRIEDRGTLLALAATAHHAMGPALESDSGPTLVVGHGALGRLLARLLAARGETPVVWETNPERQGGADGYMVVDPRADRVEPPGYRRIIDVSGDARAIDGLVGKLARGGELVLAGFYADRVSFDFPPAFMKEARFRIAAEFSPGDLAAVMSLVEQGQMSLDGLISHRAVVDPDRSPEEAYRTAFGDPSCLKMVLDWRETR